MVLVNVIFWVVLNFYPNVREKGGGGGGGGGGGVTISWSSGPVAGRKSCW